MSTLRRRLAGAVLALAATAWPLACGVGSAWATSPAGPTTLPSDLEAVTGAAGDPEASDVAVQIDSIDPGVLSPGEALRVTATLVNQTAAPLDGVVADLRLNRFRPASRADLDAWVTGSSGAVPSRVANADPVSIPAGGSVTVQLTLPAAQVGLSTLRGMWGPRGLAVEALDSSGHRLGIQRTFVLWLLDQVVPQVRVAVLAPVTSTSAGAGSLETATASGGRLAALAGVATSDPDVELAVDPALVAAASSGGPHATAWSTQLTAALARRDSIALPWDDTDLGAVAHAGRPQLLSTAMSLSAASGLAGVSARTDVVWAPDGTLDQQTVDAAAAAGARAIVVGPNTLQRDNAVSTALVGLTTDHGPLSALVPDHLLTDLLAAPASVQPGATVVTTVQRLLAELAVLAHDGADTQHDVLIAPGRDWTPDATLTAALLKALRTSPWSRLVSVSAVLGSQDEGTDRTSLPARAIDPAELPPDDVRALADARTATTAFAQGIGDGTLTADLDQRVVAPLSVAWRSDTAGRNALVQRVLADTATTRGGLSLTGPPSLNVISANAPVRFVVHNALSVPATVTVAVEPHKACLRPARSTVVTAPPGGDTQVVVNLVAIANCDVTVDASLLGQDGAAVGPAIGFSARVAPTIENVGTIVVGFLLAVGMVLGIVRTVRRGQSARRGAHDAPDTIPTLPVLGGDVPAPGRAPEPAAPRPPDNPPPGGH